MIKYIISLLEKSLKMLLRKPKTHSCLCKDILGKQTKLNILYHFGKRIKMNDIIINISEFKIDGYEVL